MFLNIFLSANENQNGDRLLLAKVENDFCYRTHFRCLPRTDNKLTGFPILNMLGILLKIATSTSWGRLVAPMTMTLQLGSVIRPSQKLINWVLIITVASWSDDDLERKNESEKIIIMFYFQFQYIMYMYLHIAFTFRPRDFCFKLLLCKWHWMNLHKSRDVWLEQNYCTISCYYRSLYNLTLV